MKSKIKNCGNHPVLKTNSLSELCERGQSICHRFGKEIIGNSETLRFEESSDSYSIVDEIGLVIGKIVPRMEEDEIWYGVREFLVDESISLERRGEWCIDNTSFVFYNVDCNKFI